MQEKQETQVQFLGWEDPLEEEIRIHSSFLAWRIPWTEEPGWQQSLGSQRVKTTEATEHGHTWFWCSQFRKKYFAKNKFLKNIFSFAYQDFKLRKPDIIWQTLENIFNINLYKLQLIVSNILTTKKNKVNWWQRH